MKEKKADTILNGDKHRKVTYKNQLVWLEHIDENNQQALVSVMDTGEKMTVPVSELEDKGPGFR